MTREALELFLGHRSPRLRLLFPSHLCRDNNDPELVTELFRQQAGQVEIVLAGREAETPVYRMRSREETVLNVEEKSVSYLDGHITTYESCAIRWSMQAV